MRPFKPAPKNASANRIRERYLHQLGLQRGGAPLTAPHLSQSNHVVVISGLPSLPEDRATTEHVMESHDFSISRHSHHTGATPNSVDASSLGGDNDDMDESDSGSVHQVHKQLVPCSGDSHSHCSKSTLSVSPNQREASETLTSMALAYPTALRKVPPAAKPTPPPSNNNTLPFSLSHSVPWRNSTSLSKPATVLLDSAEYHRSTDQDSVSSAGTCTTAESSLTAIVSRDWGAIPHTTISAAVSVSSQGGESPASTPGVYFQCGHPHLLGGNAPAIGSGGHCVTTSSLAHALNRFNIDSDCEASVASNSVMEDHIMDEDDASLDDTASRASVTSLTSVGSTKSASHSMRCRKKIGKTQRLMERAVAHERILQIRSDRSQKMRASVVYSQRMGNPVSMLALSTAMAQEAQLPESPDSSCSIPLIHVQHGKPSQASPQKNLPLHSMGDLGRTPTASNCSDLRKLKQQLGPPNQYLMSLPMGVHMALDNLQGPDGAVAPLGLHPQLASRIPAPPPVGSMLLPSSISNDHQGVFSKPKPHHIPAEVEESREVEDSTSLQHMNHQNTVDDVMEVAMTLSRLGGRTGPIPRIR